MLGYNIVSHRYLCHDVYGEGKSRPPEENTCTRIHNITNDVQIIEYPLVVPLRYPGRTLATGGFIESTDPKMLYRLESRLAEFDKFRESCIQMEERGEIMYFPLDAGLSESKLMLLLLQYTGAEEQPVIDSFPQEGRTGKGDTPYTPDHPAMVRAVDFYESRVAQVRESLDGA